ncbi:MAG: hypothetical protein MRY83_09335 [Flavobacteriales bacterium]|nr:hypothetical protein [Flavobacteriales bacterium]
MTPKALDRIYLGIILGLIGPSFGFFIYYLLEWRNRNFTEFINLFLHVNEIQAPILALSLIFNALLFFLFIRLKMDDSAKGILIGTFLYVPVMIYLKYFNA